MFFVFDLRIVQGSDDMIYSVVCNLFNVQTSSFELSAERLS